MGQAAAIVLNDGATTPVAITFSPEMVSPGLCVFVDRRKTTRALQPSFAITFSAPTGNRNTYRTGFSFDYPIEGLVNGVAAVIGHGRYVDGTWVIPDYMSEQDRKHLRAFVANAQDHALIKAYVEAYDPMY